MRKAQKGDTVRVHFSAFLDDGTQFASTLDEEPMELTIGDGKLIKCFENSLIGMPEGMKKKVRLEPAEAMGERQPELVSKVPLNSIPEPHDDLMVGSKLWVKDKNNNTVNATVTDLSDQEVTVDANHPLAGETLVFDIELMSIT